MSAHVLGHGAPRVGTRVPRVNCAARALAASALAGSLSWPGVARGHPEMSPVLVNRYLSGAVLDRTLETSLVLLYGPLPAVDERRRMDLDASGAISTAELDGARERWQQEAQQWIGVTLDDERLLLRPQVLIELGGNTGVAAAPVVVELRSTIDVAARPHRLRLAAGREPPRLGETELSFVPGPGWRMTASAQDRGALVGTESRYSYNGPHGEAGARRATFAFEPIGPESSATEPRRRTFPLGWLAVLAAGLGAVAVWVAARRRRRRHRNGNG